MHRNIRKKIEKPKLPAASGPAGERRHEIVGTVFTLGGILTLLSLVSYRPDDPALESAAKQAANWMGLVGAYLAHGLLYAMGCAAFVLVAALGYASAVAFTRGGVPLRTHKVTGYGMLLFLGTAFLQVILREHNLMGHAPGGLVGEVLGGVLISLLSSVGAGIFLAAGLVVGLILVTPFSLVQTARAVAIASRFVGRHVARGFSAAAAFLGRVAWKGLCLAGRALAREAKDFAAGLKDASARARLAEAAAEPAARTEEPSEAAPVVVGQPVMAAPAGSWFLAPPVSLPPLLSRPEPVVVTGEIPPPPEEEPAPPPEEKPAKKSFAEIRRLREPEIVIPKVADKVDPEEANEPPPRTETPAPDYKNYRLPDISLLQVGEQKETVIEQDRLREYARKLEAKLADYGIAGQVTKIMPGPVVTMYEYAPGPGIKVSRIAGLSNDLALALEAMSVRIVAPIPGRAVVGIEVANRERLTVYARDIIGHGSFTRARSKLTIALGKNIEGQPYVTDLNKMPHLLVAGATGTGKSVALNLMISSILFRNTPEDVRFIMVDPKVLELSLYDGIPHLLLPVVTDPRKANAALNWAVREMERRIQVLHGAGVRDLDSYNRKVEKTLAQDGEADASSPGAPEASAPPPPPAEEKPTAPKIEEAPAPQPAPAAKRKIIVIDKTAPAAPAPVPAPENPPALSPASVEGEPPAGPAPSDGACAPAETPATADSCPECPEKSPAEGPRQKLPHIVIVIDELADLMMTVGREVETSIARIAQKARAAGIHLIVATQRPSVNVITGLIKANLPARISFRVASKIDSRTILDQNGAETLLGNGDMLFHPPTTSEILRIHGALITEEEISRLVHHLKTQAQPIYDESILASTENADPPEGEGAAEDDEDDELYDQAVAVVAEMGQASTSMVQRKLRIGYNRAARLIERMEREGIVGPADGARPREVLVQNLQGPDAVA